MEQKYLISIVNKQKIDNDVEEITLTTEGTYATKDGKRYIMYREFEQDGQKGQSSTLKIDNTGDEKIVSLIRHDPRSGKTNLVLQENKRHLCQYGTTFGCLTLGVYTSKITDNLTEEGGSIYIEYTLDINTNLSSYNAITVTVKKISDPDEIAAS